MSRFWQHFLSNGLSTRLEQRFGLLGDSDDSRPGLRQRGRQGDRHGLFVNLVIPGGPADQAGLLEGDILIRLSEQPIHGLPDLCRLLESLPPDHPIPAVVRRRGRLLERWILLNDYRDMPRPCGR